MVEQVSETLLDLLEELGDLFSVSHNLCPHLHQVLVHLLSRGKLGKESVIYLLLERVVLRASVQVSRGVRHVERVFNLE